MPTHRFRAAQPWYESILQHIELTGHRELRCGDNPAEQEAGIYCNEGLCDHIWIVPVHAFLGDGSERGQLLRQYMSTQAGKKRVIEALVQVGLAKHAQRAKSPPPSTTWHRLLEEDPFRES